MVYGQRQNRKCWFVNLRQQNASLEESGKQILVMVAREIGLTHTRQTLKEAVL